MTAGRKRDAVLRVLRGEPLEIVAREMAATASDVSGWRDAFLEAGAASLTSRARDDRDATIARLRTKVALVARRRDLSRSQIYQWRAALREGRLGDEGGEVVGFLAVAMPTSTGLNGTLPGTGSFAVVSTIEIGLPGGRSLKVPASLPSTELRRLIRTVEGA